MADSKKTAVSRPKIKIGKKGYLFNAAIVNPGYYSYHIRNTDSLDHPALIQIDVDLKSIGENMIDIYSSGFFDEVDEEGINSRFEVLDL